MTVTINFPPDLEKTVRQQAARNGQDVDTFVLQAVNEKLAKERTIAEICVPMAQAIAESGISDEELDQFFEEAREEVWQEKQGKKP
jgi:hypothetical protein